MLSKQEIISLAYFDGVSLDEIASRRLQGKDLRSIAAQCCQWAYETSIPSARSMYLGRADALASMADKSDRLDEELDAMLLEEWLTR